MSKSTDTVVSTLRARAFIACLSMALTSACGLNPFDLGADFVNVDGDGGFVLPTDDAAPVEEPDAMGTGTDACVPDVEVCDEADNDCDGNVDEGFNLDNDPNNCGECGKTCFKFGTQGTCGDVTAGECAFTCLSGFIDLDNDIDLNGCEYVCTPTLGNEVGNCDLTDNDCDGDIDEDVDTTEDIDNCGGCGNLCRALNATPDCVPTETDPDNNPGVLEGVCQQGPCDCELDPDPDDGVPTCFADALSAVPGCEYACPVPPTAILGDGTPVFEEEVCDGVDQDCTGLADDNLSNFDRDGNPDPGADNTCHPFLNDADGSNDNDAGRGACNFGQWQCSGNLLCLGAGLPAAQDLCGNGDEDCDGTDDEDANLLTDVNNCGACGNDCNDDAVLPNTTAATCAMGVCRSLVCDQGFTFGGDNDPTQGCDYECTVTGPEVCDGEDNDCDELTDLEDLADLNLTNPGSNACRQIGGCGLSGTVTPVCGVPGQGASATQADLSMLPGTCTGGVDWYCPYDTTVVAVDDTTCDVQNVEGLCDGVDNDCDNAIDEEFPQKGKVCTDNLQGECQSSGIEVCLADKSDTFCDFTHEDAVPGRATPATFESCDGVDNDCDGLNDHEDPDGVVDDMVEVTFAAAGGSCTPGAACSDSGGDMDGTCDPDGSTCRLWIDKYEASRPDADATDGGTNETLACSSKDKIPWTRARHGEAAAACAVNGKRLCTQSEWQLACAGDGGTTPTACTLDSDCDTSFQFCNTDQGTGFCAFLHPYGTTYEPFTCNGRDWNDECRPPAQDTQEQVFPTGFPYSPGGNPGSCDVVEPTACESAFGGVDMAGNLREWTATADGSSFEVRGGSFTDIEQGISCNNDFIALQPASSFDNLGFRCCRDTPPPAAP